MPIENTSDWQEYRYGKGPRMRRFTPRVKGDRRLDVGWAEFDAKPGSTLGLDPLFIPPEIIQEGIDSGEFEPNFQHTIGTGTHLPYATGSIDSYTSDHSLGLYFDTFEGLEEAIRVLRPGGKLFVRFPMDREHIKEMKEWLKTQPVTKVRFRPDPWHPEDTERDEEGRNWVLRFTKV